MEGVQAAMVKKPHYGPGVAQRVPGI